MLKNTTVTLTHAPFRRSVSDHRPPAMLSFVEEYLFQRHVTCNACHLCTLDQYPFMYTPVSSLAPLDWTRLPEHFLCHTHELTKAQYPECPMRFAWTCIWLVCAIRPVVSPPHFGTVLGAGEWPHNHNH